MLYDQQVVTCFCFSITTYCSTRCKIYGTAEQTAMIIPHEALYQLISRDFGAAYKSFKYNLTCPLELM